MAEIIDDSLSNDNILFGGLVCKIPIFENKTYSGLDGTNEIHNYFLNIYAKLVWSVYLL